MMDFNADYIPLTSNMEQASGNKYVELLVGGDDEGRRKYIYIAKGRKCGGWHLLSHLRSQHG